MTNGSIKDLINREATICLLGLDNAGKTTLLHLLRYGTLRSSPPTRKPNMEEMAMGHINFKAWDLGGDIQGRTLWDTYYPIVDGIVYLIDSSTPERFAESKAVFSRLISADAIKDVPIIVLGNKIDQPTAVREEDIRQYFGIPSTTFGQGVRPIELQMCSLVRKQGYGEGFGWLSKQIAEGDKNKEM
jgi:GTP-binding protein SAR1